MHERASDETAASQAMFSPLGFGQRNLRYYERALAAHWVLEPRNQHARRSLAGADLRGIMLDSMYAPRLYLVGAQIDGAHFDSAHMPGSIWDDAKGIGTILRRANLRYASFKRLNLTWANLCGTDLSRADMQGTVFDKCVFDEATNLEDAILEGICFFRMEIGEWILSADVEGVQFSDCKMSDTIRERLIDCGAIISTTITGSTSPRS
jgi:uncharacterized protein YjbI with pentapeptide repeats